MLVNRHPIFQWMEGVHEIWNARNVLLFDMGCGRVGVSVKWRDDGPADGRDRYPDFLEMFSFNRWELSKWDFQAALWQHLENHKKQLWPGREA